MSLIIATLYLSKGVRAFKSLFDQKFGRCFRFSCLKGVLTISQLGFSCSLAH